MSEVNYLVDDREMTVYDCLECKKSWKQQLRENVAQCVYCQSSNTKRIGTFSAVMDYVEPEVPTGEYLVGIDEGTMDKSAVTIIRRGNPDKVVAYVSWESGHFGEAFLEMYHQGLKANQS